MTEAKVDRGLAGKREAQVREILKTNFKCWEEGAGWNLKNGSNGDEYSDDASIQIFFNGKLLKRGSTNTPDKIVWSSVHQPWSKNKINGSNEHIANELKTLIREQVQKGRPVRATVPPPFSSKKELSAPFGTACHRVT